MTEPTEQMDELKQKLAAIEHQRWADWQKWMHGLMGKLDGKEDYFVISGEYIKRWNRQIQTPYAELSEREKTSDMEQVDRYWPLIEAYLARQIQAARKNTALSIRKAMPADSAAELYVLRWIETHYGELATQADEEQS